MNQPHLRNFVIEHANCTRTENVNLYIHTLILSFTFKMLMSVYAELMAVMLMLFVQTLMGLTRANVRPVFLEMVLNAQVWLFTGCKID